MKLDRFVLAQTMAFLIAIPPQSKLAKLLNFCLTAKAGENNTGIKILEMTCELMEKPSKLPYWSQDIMGLELDYTTEEWVDLGEMGIKNALAAIFKSNL
ncbi:MAG: hypothetical protein DCF19_14655 [Pseudanabaena frigida]|uniref:Uncharacterized protein n=1 Tax=Pseudanabaena frigida TaxID=945775 RepID=A0A2W4Y7I2_9CYAN|nr:MAG: hypothetical protein DCF19_14655 [Pseudanabaena frigida]